MATNTAPRSSNTAQLDTDDRFLADRYTDRISRGLTEAIELIRADAKRDTQVYLDEVVTPFGGE